uniref:tyrosine-type recombinase/integrase n=1 Tax=Zhongshania antarctica TaxID=641702 RepID=UPI0021F80EA3
VTFAATTSVRLHGKGRKQRTVPLWKETATEIRQWLEYADLRLEQPLIPNRSGRPMTRTNVAERLNRAVSTAKTTCPQLVRSQDFTSYLATHYSHAPVTGGRRSNSDCTVARP